MKKVIIIFLSLIIMLNIGCLNRSTLCASERIQNKENNDCLGDIEKNNRLKEGHCNTNIVYSCDVIEMLTHNIIIQMENNKFVRSSVARLIEMEMQLADRFKEEDTKIYHEELQRSLNRKIYDEYTAIYSRLLEVKKLLSEYHLQLTRKYYSTKQDRIEAKMDAETGSDINGVLPKP